MITETDKRYILKCKNPELELIVEYMLGSDRVYICTLRRPWPNVEGVFEPPRTRAKAYTSEFICRFIQDHIDLTHIFTRKVFQVFHIDADPLEHLGAEKLYNDSWTIGMGDGSGR